MKTAQLKTIVGKMVSQVRSDYASLVSSMPSAAKTEGQRRLQRKHGAPRSFAQACVRAIGEISSLEAMAAIREYKERWDAAK